MYRPNDPRFRRRLNEIGQTLESANETAQSSIYIFGQTYVRPCLASIGHCVTTCVDASCPSLNLSQRDRLRRQRGRGRSAGRAELNFDFYDDWDDDENDGLLGWGNDEFDRLVSGGSGTASGGGGGGAGTAGYGTLSTTTQPSRSRGMSYQPKHAKRKPTVLPHEPGGVGGEPTLIAETGFWGRLFGGKGLRYQPSAADLQEHPGTLRLGRDITEGEALLSELEGSPSQKRHRRRRHRKDSSSSPTGRTTRARSGTTGSADTRDSYSSRGDLWPSDEEADAIPLDDEFAMVLERRLTGSEPASANGSVRRSRSSTTNAPRIRRRDSRPSASSRASTRRTFSSRSSLSANNLNSRSRAASGVIEQLAADDSVLAAGEGDAVPIDDAELLAEADDDDDDDEDSDGGHGDDERELVMPTLSELNREERELARAEDAAVERRRENAQRLAIERGLAVTSVRADEAGAEEAEEKEEEEEMPSKEAPVPSQEPSSSSPEMREAVSAATTTSVLPPNKGSPNEASVDQDNVEAKDEGAEGA